MEKSIVVYSFKGVQYSDENEWPKATASDWFGSHKHNVEVKNVETVECIQ